MKITIESPCLSRGLYHLMITFRAETSKDGLDADVKLEI